MVRYCVKYENDKLIAIGTGYGGTEITKEEYDRLLAEIQQKANLVNQLYNGDITIEDIPAEWQEEIQRRVDERIAMNEAMAEEYISSDEFYSMVEGVL